jgi:hypothetical protein
MYSKKIKKKKKKKIKKKKQKKKKFVPSSELEQFVAC